MSNHKEHDRRHKTPIQDDGYLGRWRGMIMEWQMDIGNVIFLKLENACVDVYFKNNN